MEQSNCGPLRLGRFPVLSVMYLYNARKLLHAYEKRFLKHNSWKDVGEPAELASKFRSVAGKCLRFYLNETVAPVEMLLLLNRDAHLKKVFSQAHVTPPVKQRLGSIYYVKWGLTAQFVRNTVVLERRPLTRAEKLQWLMRVVCVLLCVALIAGMPFAVNAISPFIEENGALNVNHWWQIRFKSDKTYSLQNDVTVPQGFFAEEMNCQLIGNGHTVTVTGGSLFGTVNGKISDVIFETNGSPLMENVALGATLDSVTVNATVDMETDKSIGFVAINNYGNITHSTVNASGKLSAIAAEKEESGEEEEQTEETFICGGIVANNNTTAIGNNKYQDANLTNCTVNYDNFILQGQQKANAAFGGIAGQNVGWVKDCQINGKISSDTFDVAGICSENNYVIQYCVNNANISQKTNVAEWSPIASGIVMTNYYVVDNCQNNGAITCSSTAAALTGHQYCVYAAGIAYENISVHDHSYVQYSINAGEVTATANEIYVAAAGICNASNGVVVLSANTGKVVAEGSSLVEAAGIVNEAYYDLVSQDVNQGEVYAKSQGEARVGGIASYSCAMINECFSAGSIEVSAAICYVGGILGYSVVMESSNHFYYGITQKSIAKCQINATKSSSTNGLAAVGGIVGYEEEKANASNVYVGGRILSCFFVGELQTNADYVGGIAGVVGKNVYNVSASESDVEKKTFYGNAYVNTCNVAFGATQANGSYQEVSDVGASGATVTEIESNETYQEILKKLGITN